MAESNAAQPISQESQRGHRDLKKIKKNVKELQENSKIRVEMAEKCG